MILLIFLLGTVLGSALTAVLWRLETGESWMRGRSKCRSCAKTLTVRELVPIVSWFLQRGRCAGCGGGIAASYPAIELVTGLLLAADFALRFGADGALFLARPGTDALLLARDAYAIGTLVVVFVFDLTAGEILDRVTLPAIVLLGAASLGLGMPLASLALGVAIGAGFFGAQYLVSRGAWIGGGDVRMGALMGSLLGFPGVLLALFLAYVSGAVVALGLLASGRKKWGSRMPFGTFLAAGSLVALWFGDGIIRWYAS